MRASGLTAAHLTVGNVGTMSPLDAFEQIMRSIAHWERQIDSSPEVFSRIRCAADISAAKRGRRTAADAIAASKKPLAFTHTGCAAIAEHPRHRTDAEIRAVAEGGGVIGIYVMPYLSRGKQPTAADVVAHLEHALSVAGSDHNLARVFADTWV